MADLDKIVADLVFEGHFVEPNVQPGMVATCRYVATEKLDESKLDTTTSQRLENFRRKLLSEEHKLMGKRTSSSNFGLDNDYRSEEKIEESITDIRKRINEILNVNKNVDTESLITKVTLNVPHLAPIGYIADWNIYAHTFNGPLNTANVFPKSWSESRPAIFANQTFDILVPRSRGSQYTHRITARVLTQAALPDDSLVYLTDADSRVIYAISATKLLKYSNSSPINILGGDQKIKPKARGSNLPLQKNETARNMQAGFSFQSPSDVAEYINRTVLYQEPAVERVSVAVYDHHVRPQGVKKSNVILIGPTGTGKTELARTMAEILGVPFTEAKLAGLSSSGYKSTNLVTAVFEGLYHQRQNPNMERAVIFLDEIDKLAPQGGSEVHGFGHALQQELIGWTESANVLVPIETHSHFKIDTTNQLFIGAGAFVGLDEIIARRLGKYDKRMGFGGEKKTSDARFRTEELYEQMIADDFVQYGFKPELVGRFPVLAYTKPLDREALIGIIKNGAKSTFNQQIHLLKQGYGLSVNIDERVYGMVADAAAGMGTGARGIETASNRLFEGIKFNIRQLTAGKTSLTIAPEMAYSRLKSMLPEGYKI